VEAFPFTNSDWSSVEDAAWSVVNASGADDEVLCASHLIEFFDVLERLRAKYGDHPVLLETQADFVEDDSERIVLYRKAASIAVSYGLPTLSIRLSLAKVLLDSNEHDNAQKELRACEGELNEADDFERESWGELFAKLRQTQ